jgi:ankyrin repeat protein
VPLSYSDDDAGVGAGALLPRTSALQPDRRRTVRRAGDVFPLLPPPAGGSRKVFPPPPKSNPIGSPPQTQPSSPPSLPLAPSPQTPPTCGIVGKAVFVKQEEAAGDAGHSSDSGGDRDLVGGSSGGSIVDGEIDHPSGVRRLRQLQQLQQQRRHTSDAVSPIIDLQSGSGMTPLAWTVKGLQPEAFMALLAEGSDPNVADADLVTPLHHCTILGLNFGYAAKLLESGADANACDKGGNTALMYACASGLVEVVEVLLAMGADSSICNMHSTTALIQATIHGHVNVVARLLQHPAIAVSQRDSSGRIALHWACSAGQAACADLLVTQDPETAFIESHAGDTPCHVAVRQDRLDCMQLVCNVLTWQQRQQILAVENGSSLTLAQLAVEQRAMRCQKFIAEHGSDVPPPGTQGSLIGPASDKSRKRDRDDAATDSSSSGDDDSSGNGTGDSKEGRRAAKPKQTLEQARARRRNYMRLKRAEIISKESCAEGQVAVLEDHNQQLTLMVAQLRREAASLRTCM